MLRADPLLKIVHVITGLERHGAESVLVSLVLSGRREFAHVVIALRGEGHFGPVLRDAGVPVHALRLTGIRGLGRSLLALVRIFRDERPDVVQTWLYHADVLGGIAARLTGVKSIIWGIRNTNLEVAAIGRSARAAVSAGARLSHFVPDVIICNSVESARVHAEFGYRADRIRHVPNGCDVEHFQPDEELRAATRATLGVGPEELLIGNVGRWDPQKDHATLCAATREVAVRWPTARLLLVGEGLDAANESLLRLIRSAGLEDRVILAGPRVDMTAVMNALDLHVLSSLGEAFPNVVAEAMACGVPCVVTDVGDARRIVGDTGWIAQPRDSKSLAGAMLEALETIATHGRKAIGSRGRARVVTHFGLPRMIGEYAALWRELAVR